MQINPISGLTKPMNIPAHRAVPRRDFRIPPPGADVAEISEDALAFSRALTALRGASPARPDARIDALKRAVQNGEYAVDCASVADAILSHALGE